MLLLQFVLKFQLTKIDFYKFPRKSIILAVPIATVVMIVKHIKKKKENYVKPEREKLSPSAILFIIGTFFVMFSGVAFGVAGWVKTTPTGRVGIMLLAVFVSFGIGILFNRFLKLDGTSSTFFAIGNFMLGISTVTAGHYGLIGSWLSAEGGGSAMVFAISVMLMAVSSYIEYRMLKKPVFLYFCFLSLSACIVFLSAQVAGDYDSFALLMITFQAVMTACLYFFGFRENKPLRVSMIISCWFFASIAFLKVTDSYFSPDTVTYFIMSAITLQLIVYGILFNKPSLKALQSVSSLLLIMMIIFDIKEHETIVFSLSTLALYVANRFIPQIKNKFSEILTFIFAVTGSCVVLSEQETAMIVVPVAMSVLIMLYAFSEKKSTQVFFGLVSPVLPFFTATYFNSVIFENYSAHMCFILCSVALSVITALIIFLPVYAFGLYAKFPRKTDTILYANMIGSAIIICGVFMQSSYTFLLFACAVHFAVSFSMKNNFTAFASSFFGLATLCEIIAEHSDNEICFEFIIFVLIMIVSRVFFKDSIYIRTEKHFRIDCLMFSAVAFFIYIIDYSEFLCMVAFALFVANFVRKKTSTEKSGVILSISAFIMTLAFFNRPFLVSDSDMINSKVNLAVVALMGIAYRYIWKNHPKASEISSQVIFMLDFSGLIFDALYFHTLSNTVFVLAVTAVVLVISFITKSKKWFATSSVALVIITVYSMKKYFMSLDWWAYLFIAGLALIAVASLNEYCKKSGKSIKTKISEVFSDWK